MVALESNWANLWRRLNATGDSQAVCNDLLRRYAEQHRAYHNLEHLEHCFSEFADAKALVTNREEVEFALWFHDAVYDPRAGDNEERSAKLAAEVASRAGLPSSFGERVQALILATKQHEPTTDYNSALLLDVDLSILGQPPERFDRYEAEIRSEYSWVPEGVFRVKRGEILATFLTRPVIYQTSHFRSRYEQAARVNLQRSIVRLKQT